MMALRVAVIGCGAFTRRYHLPAIEADGAARLSAIVDPACATEPIATVGRRHGAALLSSLDRLLDGAMPDAAIISSPTGLHAHHAEALLQRGVAVLVDKPFVLSTMDAERLTHLAAARDVLAGVGFNRRLDPGFLRARAMIAAGEIGPLRHVETTQLGAAFGGWKNDPALAGGGPFQGRGAHMADIVPWLVGAAPQGIRATVTPRGAGEVDAGGHLDAEFEGFTWRMTCVAGGLKLWDEVRVFGDTGALELVRPLPADVGWGLALTRADGTRVELVPADTRPGAVTANFLEALRGQATLACPFAEAVGSVRIIEAAFRSATRDGVRLAMVDERQRG
jgi:predicted dehydrogenase